MDSMAEIGSVRIMLPDRQTIPMNHRDINPKLRCHLAFPRKTALEEKDQKKELPLCLSPDVSATPCDLASDNHWYKDLPPGIPTFQNSKISPGL